jgi:dienelactone hydrolase
LRALPQNASMKRGIFYLAALPLIVQLNWAYAESFDIVANYIESSKTLKVQGFWPQSLMPRNAVSSVASVASATVKKPAVIMLHGCGGIGRDRKLNARHAMWKDWLNERGFVVVFPESFTSRGFEEICTQKFSDRTLKQSDRVDDVIAARRWLIARDDIDASRIVLWGFSHGGGTVLATITKRIGEELAPETKFAQAISFYPGCTSYMMSARVPKISSPLALLIGEADDWTPAAPCKAWVKTLLEYKLPATITTFPDAFHDFDNPNGKLRVRKDVPNGVNGTEKGVTVGPNPEAREAAKRQVAELLKPLQTR